MLFCTTGMCRPRPLPPHVRGKWRGSLPHSTGHAWCQSPPTGTSTINLPVLSYKFHGNLKATEETAAIQNAVLARLLPYKGRLRKCMIIELPMEILLEIVGYLVPTGTSFHVFPSTKERYNGGPRKTTLHKFCAEPLNEADRVMKGGTISAPRPHLTALARTCRILYEAYHEIMYGRNYFILEISASDVFPTIEGPTSMPVESWTKLVHGKLHQPMWPLTHNSIQYVRHLTLLGTSHPTGDQSTSTTLRAHFLKAADLLKQARRLHDLTIDVRKGSHSFVSLKAPQPLPEFNPNRRLKWGVQGAGDSVLRLCKTITSEQQPSIAEVWELFEDINGVRDVVLSGHITPEMAEDLRAKMMGPAVISPGSKTPRTLQKSAMKRKRVSEPLKSTKRRRRV